MNLLEILQKAIDRKASDIHITAGSPVIIRVNGSLVPMDDNTLSPDDTKELTFQVVVDKQRERLDDLGEVDTSYSNPGLGRFRINAYKQRAAYGMALRVVNSEIPSITQLGLPKVIEKLCEGRRGLILVTGPTGSGKSTTLASMINQMNHHRQDHIITIEDPIEFLHKHNTSIVNQREIGSDTMTFANALRASLRQDPDVILVGEMRDLETISTAITAAETGHLVLSTLHTIGAAKTIDRIIDVFSPHHQQQVRIQLASMISAIISQQILPRADGKGRVAAFEIMVATQAIRNLIREGKTHQIQTIIQTGNKYGMQTMDNSLYKLYKKSLITLEVAKKYAVDEQLLMQQVMGGLY